MDSNIFAALIVGGAILVLSVVLFLLYRQRQKGRARVEWERRGREEKERRRKLQAKQRQAGHRVFVELEQAARQNQVANLLPGGKPANGVGLIEVRKMEIWATPFF